MSATRPRHGARSSKVEAESPTRKVFLGAGDEPSGLIGREAGGQRLLEERQARRVGSAVQEVGIELVDFVDDEFGGGHHLGDDPHSRPARVEQMNPARRTTGIGLAREKGVDPRLELALLKMATSQRRAKRSSSRSRAASRPRATGLQTVGVLQQCAGGILLRGIWASDGELLPAIPFVSTGRKCAPYYVRPADWYRIRRCHGLENPRDVESGNSHSEFAQLSPLPAKPHHQCVNDKMARLNIENSEANKHGDRS
jgi:hypothetical protein